MATTTTNIENGNVYLTNGTLITSNDTITTSGDQRVVAVSVTQIEHSVNKDLKEIPWPSTSGNPVAPRNIWMDLKMIKQVLTITGILCDETSESAFNKKTNLLILAGADMGILNQRSIQVIWGLSTDRQIYTAQIVKMSIKEIPVQYTPAEADATNLREEKGFDVQIQLAIGAVGQIQEKG